jgi:hypothetical protein
VARLAGVEPAARGFEGRCSIQLSYRRVHLLVPSPRGRVKRWLATGRQGKPALTPSIMRSRTLRFRGAGRLGEAKGLRGVLGEVAERLKALVC